MHKCKFIFLVFIVNLAEFQYVLKNVNAVSYVRCDSNLIC